MKKKLISIILFLGLTSSLFAAGMPVFDLESWIYSVMEYYQMIEQIENTYKQIVQAGEQFEKAYKTLTTGDIDKFMSIAKSASFKAKRAVSSMDKALDLASDATYVAAGLRDGELNLKVRNYYRSLQNDAEYLVSKSVDSFSDFKDEMVELKRERIENQESNASEIASTSSSESLPVQLAAMNQSLSNMAAEDISEKVEEMTAAEYEALIEDTQQLEAALEVLANIQDRYFTGKDIMKEMNESVPQVNFEF